jgi:DNA invertase Pin-like site-specific DNA recombinase
MQKGIAFSMAHRGYIVITNGDHIMRRAALYLRVSTIDQTTANQDRELREVAARMGCEIAKVYKDHGISGAKGRDGRPAFDAMFQMMGVFAEFERAMIAERVRAGMARAKSQGTHCGRPRVSAAKEAAVRSALAGGKGICSTARDAGIGVATVQRIAAEMKAS